MITGGNITNNPIAAYIQGNTALQPTPTLADLNGYDPTTSGVPVTAPGAWSGVGLGSSNLPSSAPGALGTSTLPVYTGQSYSLSQLTESLPNTDTSSTDGYAGIYVLRLTTYQKSDSGNSTTYDSADISVNSSTGAWSLVYSPLATTTTTLVSADPGEPTGLRNVSHVDAEVTDASAPGTVQFESGGTAVGSSAAGRQRHGLAHDHRAAGRHRLPHRGLHADNGCGVLRIDQHQPRLVRDQRACG